MSTSVSATAQQELNKLSELFEVSDESLLKITQGFLNAYRQGLQVPHQAVTMGYVAQKPSALSMPDAVALALAG